MKLRGWDYTGRNIGPELHKQFKIMVDCLSDASFVLEQTWGNPLQEKLAKKIGVSSSGAVRTVKKMCDNFGFFLPNSISSKEAINSSKILSKRGAIVYQAATLEMQITNSFEFDENTKNKALLEVKSLYEEAYCDALIYYHFKNSDGTYFYPLSATIKALRKYKKLDKWEWYLLNTLIRHNNNSNEEEMLDKCIKEYRDGKCSFSMKDVIEKPKGHQYTPQYFEFAGLIHIVQGSNWSVSDSEKHIDIKNMAINNKYENI